MDCTLQSGMLAQQDPWTPAKLVSIHVSTKLAGNLLLVTCMGMGLPGAAWASVAAQWVTAAAVSVAVCKKTVRILNLEAVLNKRLELIPLPIWGCHDHFAICHMYDHGLARSCVGIYGCLLD